MSKDLLFLIVSDPRGDAPHASDEFAAFEAGENSIIYDAPSLNDVVWCIGRYNKLESAS